MESMSHPDPAPGLADRFRRHVPQFTVGGAPLYAHLAGQAANRLERTGPNAFRDVLTPWRDEPPGRLLPLRLFAAVHGWVLAGELPALASHYPSAGGGQPPEGSWPAFEAAVVERAAELPELLTPALQHNEPSRAAALAIGFLMVARENELPLRLLEVGASAGLLLRWDHYLESWWFPTMFETTPPPGGSVDVVERRGCDLLPINPTAPENEIRLKSMVWPDLADHVRILGEAIEVCRRVPATVDQADGADWLERQLAQRRPGVITVVFHSMTRRWEPSSMERLEDLVNGAGEAATPAAPLAYLRFEPPASVVDVPAEHVETRLTTWPGGTERLLATSVTSGRKVRRLQ